MRTSIPSDKIHIADHGDLCYPQNSVSMPKLYSRWLFDVPTTPWPIVSKTQGQGKADRVVLV